MATMEAKYNGICSDCGRQIKAGQPIQATQEKGWRHASGLICKDSEPAKETQARPRAFVPEIPAILAMGPANARIRLRTAAGDILIVKGQSLTGVTAKVISADKSCFYGYIRSDGKWGLTRDEGVEHAVETVKAFAADPAKVAKEYGLAMHSCCFCARPLTDERSTHMGYGPICAGHYGLPWGEAA